MIQNTPHNVSAAFEILLEEVEAEIDFVSHLGANAFQTRELSKVAEIQARAQVLISFRDKVALLRSEWNQLLTAAEKDEDEEILVQRRNLGRVRKGLRTPAEHYYLPVLQTLVSMGGSGKVSDVLEKVGDRMKPVLKKVDYEPLASDPSNPRWRNTSQWARYSMIQEGLLKADSPRGIWEISDKGREYLQSAASSVDEGTHI